MDVTDIASTMPSAATHPDGAELLWDNDDHYAVIVDGSALHTDEGFAEATMASTVVAVARAGTWQWRCCTCAGPVSEPLTSCGAHSRTSPF